MHASVQYSRDPKLRFLSSGYSSSVDKMGAFKSVVLLCVLGLLCFPSSVTSLTFAEKAAQIKLDATWIDKKARDMVDLVFVMDRSGSVQPNQLNQAKEFVKDFLDYFSVAQQHTQVGMIMFDNGVTTTIPLRYDNHKCKFMGELEKVPITTGGGTNANAGLGRAIELLRQNGRRNSGSLQVVVFITDGDWNAGGDPAGQVRTLKAEEVLVIVITIGINIRRQTEMLSWASNDNKGKPMAFPLENFKLFAQLAYYIHKGGHTSLFLPIDSASCQNKCLTASGAACLCDSLATRGQPTCGCDPGNFVQVAGAKEQCAKCPIGKYQEEKNVFKTCKSCPTGQTTLAVKSTNRQKQCLCSAGFWNARDKSRTPDRGHCSRVTCQRDSLQVLDQHFIQLNGTCQFSYGQSCSYQCFAGFITGGVRVRNCQQNGKMNPPPAMCHPLQCPIITKVPSSNGWSCMNQKGKPQSGSYPYRTQCRNKCLPGFHPRRGTNQFVICGLDQDHKNGKWSGDSLVCEPRTCLPLPSVLNGQYNQRECAHNESQRTYGKKCSVACNVGFVNSEDVEWVCGTDGQWTNSDKNIYCKDIQPPQILTCPQHVRLDNNEREGYAVVQLKPLDAFDNDKRGVITQTMSLQLAGSTNVTEYPCNKAECGEASYGFPIGTSRVNFTLSDRSGNAASCLFEVIVRDIEPPTVLQCDGPVTDKDGFIFADSDRKFVDWKEPEFSDNSDKPLDVYSTGPPGEYRVGRIWSFVYTAKDAAGNTAKCEFSFKLTGMRCPQLRSPSNGALVCDKLAFGVYCVPQCQKGLARLLPDHIVREPADYFCSVKGKWLPHDEVGDCSIRVPTSVGNLDRYEFSWFEGDCHDEKTQQKIIQNTIDALNSGGPSFTGQGFKDSQHKGLTPDDFEVFCGPKNESIIQLGGRITRVRRDIDVARLQQPILRDSMLLDPI